MKNFILLIYVICLGFVGNSQDYHLSQFEAAPLYLNPAMTAQNFTEGMDYRASSLYRSQWGSISSKPFSTAYLSYDAKLRKKWGIGFNLINNQAGAPTFRTFNLMLNGSYNIISDPNSEHILTTGLQLGLMNKSFKTDNLLFDQQYSSATGQFDANLNSGENIASRSYYRFDAGWGIYYRYKPKDKNFSPYTGLSLGHITFPNQRFILGSEALPLIWKLNIGSSIQINDAVRINPMVLYMNQKKANELYIKCNGTYQLNNEDYDLRMLLGYRNKDAFVLGFGMRYKDFVGMISYDLNTSYLSTYTGGRGGFEFGISYQGIYRNEKIKSLMKSSF